MARKLSLQGFAFLARASMPHQKELLHHLLRCVAKEQVEVEDPPDRSVGHGGSRLQSHLWKKKKKNAVQRA